MRVRLLEPGALLNPDKAIPANPWRDTGPYIVPEWYLGRFAILKSDSRTSFLVILNGRVDLVLFAVPCSTQVSRPFGRFRPVYRVFFCGLWWLTASFSFLQEASPPRRNWLPERWVPILLPHFLWCCLGAARKRRFRSHSCIKRTCTHPVPAARADCWAGP